MNVGIIIPVRYELSESPSTWMHPLEADLIAHIEHAQEFGAVYWDINILQGLCREDVRMEKNVNLPTCCYFYDSNQESKNYREVTYKAEIIESYCLDELRDLLDREPDEGRFIPQWRKQCLTGNWYDTPEEHPDWAGEEHKPSKLWIKLRNLRELNPPLTIDNFRKWNGELLRGVRGAYVQCLNSK